MRTLDRYILRSFAIPFFYCLSAFIILFIIGDLFEHLGDFLKLPGWFLVALRYYAFFVPSVFIFIVPIAILLGLLYSLGHLQRHNEINAMRAGGIGIYRVVAPLLWASFFLSLAVFAINETVAPRALRQSQLLKEDEFGPENGFDSALRDVTYFNPVTNQEFYFQTFDMKNGAAEGIKIYERRPDGQTHRAISAERGALLDSSWWLFDGLIYTYPEDSVPLKQSFGKLAFDFNLRHDDLVQSKRELSGLSLAEIIGMLERKKGFPRSALRPVLVEMHQKISLPLACLIMGGIGVGFGIRVGRGSLMVGVSSSLLLGFLYYVLYSLSVAFGKQGYLPPALAAWLGNIIFGLAGAISLSRLN